MRTGQIGSARVTPSFEHLPVITRPVNSAIDQQKMLILSASNGGEIDWSFINTDQISANPWVLRFAHVMRELQPRSPLAILLARLPWTRVSSTVGMLIRKGTHVGEIPATLLVAGGLDKVL